MLMKVKYYWGFPSNPLVEQYLQPVTILTRNLEYPAKERPLERALEAEHTTGPRIEHHQPGNTGYSTFSITFSASF
jgi:hypothetical protein